MTITVHVGRQQAEQATKQLAKLIDVISIDDVTGQRVVAHELMLIRMHAPTSRHRRLVSSPSRVMTSSPAIWSSSTR